MALYKPWQTVTERYSPICTPEKAGAFVREQVAGDQTRLELL